MAGRGWLSTRVYNVWQLGNKDLETEFQRFFNIKRKNKVVCGERSGELTVIVLGFHCPSCKDATLAVVVVQTTKCGVKVILGVTVRAFLFILSVVLPVLSLQ